VKFESSYFADRFTLQLVAAGRRIIFLRRSVDGSSVDGRCRQQSKQRNFPRSCHAP